MALQERTRSEAVIEARRRYVACGIATTPLVVARASGARLEAGLDILEQSLDAGCREAV